MVSIISTCLFLDSHINLTGFYTKHLQVFVIISKSYRSLYETPAFSLTSAPFDHVLCLQVPHKSQHTVKISVIALTRWCFNGGTLCFRNGKLFLNIIDTKTEEFSRVIYRREVAGSVKTA
jgi:hypothetical protein